MQPPTFLTLINAALPTVVSFCFKIGFKIELWIDWSSEDDYRGCQTICLSTARLKNLQGMGNFWTVKNWDLWGVLEKGLKMQDWGICVIRFFSILPSAAVFCMHCKKSYFSFVKSTFPILPTTSTFVQSSSKTIRSKMWIILFANAMLQTKTIILLCTKSPCTFYKCEILFFAVQSQSQSRAILF